MLRRVDFPLPLAPTTPIISPSETVRIQSLQRLDFQGCIGGSAIFIYPVDFYQVFTLNEWFAGHQLLSPSLIAWKIFIRTNIGRKYGQCHDKQ